MARQELMYVETIPQLRCTGVHGLSVFRAMMYFAMFRGVREAWCFPKTNLDHSSLEKIHATAVSEEVRELGKQ